ncbi:MotA/TolQ/ExbB proton channel family protein [Sneathiella limimaris]|uniref:MotA/TolQ/ExbB proton channel family protein n=1 Tax=Sneathiella limimaris TaxID=1964213 RepID=UPI00146D8740|nr:MotA/TolQ/ExbB proton channel family protein [Sneathiella limimaris]
MPLEILLSDSFEKLGVMGWPLLVSSILAAMIILERAIFFLLVDFNGRKLSKRLMGILNIHKAEPKALRDEVVSLAVSENARPLARGLNLLKLVAAVAPLLGLLGTILGIIDAFRVIAAADAPVTPNMIADGLWEALLTTAFGLMIALPSVISAGIFQSHKQRIIETVVARLNAQSLSFELEKTSHGIDQSNANSSNQHRIAS